MKKLTNTQIIKKLLLYMQEAIERLKRGEIELKDKDYYNHPCYYEYPKTEEDIMIMYTDYEDRIMIKVALRFEKGKYDHATLCAYFMKDAGELLKTSNGAIYGFSKEFRGKGHGYYADVSPEGKIIYGEWD